MLGALLSAINDPASALPHAAKRIGILMALVLLLWSAVFAGMIGLVFAAQSWLALKMGESGAWALAGGAVTMAGALGIWLSTRALRPQVAAPSAAPPPVSIAHVGQLVGEYPMEAVCVAAVTGVLASRADVGRIVDQLLAHALDPR